MSARAQEALRAAVERLRAVGVPDPARDARLLLAEALGIAPGRLTLQLPDPLAPDAASAFERMIAARAARQPVAQILGRRLFWGRAFAVTPDVLDPRPETETLIAAALDAPFRRVLDLGTGSGAILLTLLAERPVATGMGCDLSAAALAVARENAQALGLGSRATLCRSDWFSSVRGSFDLIVSTPPYIAAPELAQLAPEPRDWEPRMALVPAGDDGSGLGAYRAILAGLGPHLAPRGRLVVEIGAAQGRAVAALFLARGLAQVRVLRDLDGRDRVVCGLRA